MRYALLCLAAGMVLALTAETASAQWPQKADVWARRFAATRPWHDGYYHTAHGYPVPLVVPPTAHTQASWGWGVTQSAVMPIYHRYPRSYPGYYGAGGGNAFRPTPRWPSHTDQFGVYYVRGPW